jgi:hypothetical protein
LGGRLGHRGVSFYVSLDRFLVEINSFALLDGYRALRAFAQAIAKTVAILVVDQTRLTVDNPDRTFFTGNDAVTAAVAQVFVDVDDVSYSHCASLAVFCTEGRLGATKWP